MLNKSCSHLVTLLSWDFSLYKLPLIELVGWKDNQTVCSRCCQTMNNLIKNSTQCSHKYLVTRCSHIYRCSGCGSVGRQVASDTKGRWFKSSHRQNFIMNISTVKCWKDENRSADEIPPGNFLNLRSCNAGGVIQSMCSIIWS